MASNPYEDKTVDCTLEVSFDDLRNRSVIVTGGANGLGKAYVHAFANAGLVRPPFMTVWHDAVQLTKYLHRAYVTIGDLDERGGGELVSKFPNNVQFVKCNVTFWEDQLDLFKAAIANSPEKSCDVVIANAGISGPDPVIELDGDPSKPNLRIVETNLIAQLYTAKLSMHYFRVHPINSKRDRCLIIKGSLTGYVDQPGSPQYNASKWGGRGLMRCLRRTTPMQGIRVNYVAPWYIRTTIMSEQVQKHVESKGVKFALQEDACKAMLRLASDKTLNGRALGIVPQEEVPDGFIDLVHDDYKEGDFLKTWQEVVLLTSHRLAVPNDKQ